MDENVEIIKGASLWRDAWKRLLRNKLAVFGMIILAIMVIAVIIGPAIISWTTGYTYDLIPADRELVRAMHPSFQHLMGTDDAGRDIFARVLQGGRISLSVGLISTIVSLIVGVSYGAIAGYLGGRIDNVMMRIVDILYAIPYILIVIVLLNAFSGANTAILVSWSPQIIASVAIILTCIFSSALLYRKLFERADAFQGGLIRWLITIVFVIVTLVVIGGLVYLAASALVQTGLGASLSEAYTKHVNPGLSQILLLFFALGLVSWLTMARVVRGQILSLKNQEFVMAAKATGVSTPAIIFRHLIPNALGPVIVYATLTVPSVMLTEAFLSYLGLGVQAPFASWGSLAADGVKNIAIFPWQLLFPGLTMALTLFSLNFLGDGLRDALDPQTRKF
ncbi:MAG: ABC transporter permease [Pyrinomonadaceae bacterium]